MASIAQLNKINPLLDEIIDQVWLLIYNKRKGSKEDNTEKDSKKDNKMALADKDKLNLINETIKKLRKLKIEIRKKFDQ